MKVKPREAGEARAVAHPLLSSVGDHRHRLDHRPRVREASRSGRRALGCRRCNVERVAVGKHHVVRIGDGDADAQHGVISRTGRVAHVLRLDVSREELRSEVLYRCVSF